MDEKLKSENVQKEQFSELGVGLGVKAGVENGAMLTTYLGLLRYTSECTIS